MTSERHPRPGLLGIVAAAVLLAAVTAAGCAPTGGGADKAGGAADPVVLRLANTSGGLDRHPALRYFVDQVKELSDGALRIDVASLWGDQLPSAEQQVVADVAAGEVDLGWVGTSVFDTVGDTDFQALTAPMLIDSYPLERAVLDSDIPTRMLAGLDRLGVYGIAVLADGLRKPIAVSRPLLRPGDYEGITFQAFRSQEHAAAIRALGAYPTDIGVDVRALRDGAIDGFEKGLRIYEINGFSYVAPYVTANVNLWPHTLALIANPDTVAGLTATQREWLTSAASDAESRSTDLTDDDPEMLVRLCQEGARFADASPSDLDEMRQALAPEYATMNRDPTTKTFVEQIEALKETTDPGPGLDVPAECTGPVAVTPARGSTAPPTTAVVGVATVLDGTYRWTITAADAMAYGTPNDKTAESKATFPRIFTVTMYDGHVTLAERDADGSTYDDAGTYTVNGDRLQFDWDSGSVDANTVRVDADGTLHLTAQDATDPGGVFVMTSKPWTKIAGGTDPTATVLDGTYRWTLTKDDALTHGLPGDRTPEVLATYPSYFTMTMDDGHWTLHHDGLSGEVEGDGSYTVDGDRVTFDWDGNRLTFAFRVDSDGTFHLQPHGVMDPGDVFVWSTNPWTRIAGGTDITTTVLDGTYRWTLTKDDAVAHGHPRPQELPTFPWVFTMTMDAGTWQLTNIDGQGVANQDAGHGSYSVEDDHVVFHEAAEVFDYTFSVDADGTVHLVAQLPINPGTAWVFATNPWTNID